MSPILYNLINQIINLSSTVSLPILTFHSIDDRPSAISFSPRVFGRGMTKLHESGHRTLSLLEAADCLRAHF